MTTRETHSPGDDCPGGHQDEAMTTETEKRALEGDPEAGLKWAAELWNKLQERKATESEALRGGSRADKERIGKVHTAFSRGGSRTDGPLLGNAPPRRAGVEKLAKECVEALFSRHVDDADSDVIAVIARVLNTHLAALVPDSGALVEARTLLERLTEEDVSNKEIGRITEDARRILTQAQQPGPAVALGLDAQREADVRLGTYIAERAFEFAGLNPEKGGFAHDLANWIGDWRRAEAEA